MQLIHAIALLQEGQNLICDAYDEAVRGGLGCSEYGCCCRVVPRGSSPDSPKLSGRPGPELILGGTPAAELVSALRVM
jgi:transposase